MCNAVVLRSLKRRCQGRGACQKCVVPLPVYSAAYESVHLCCKLVALHPPPLFTQFQDSLHPLPQCSWLRPDLRLDERALTGCSTAIWSCSAAAHSDSRRVGRMPLCSVHEGRMQS